MKEIENAVNSLLAVRNEIRDLKHELRDKKNDFYNSEYILKSELIHNNFSECLTVKYSTLFKMLNKSRK